ncbi:hypothetical protein WNB94_06640 [Aquabacterium sp. A3]|uniref:hypothetical protein n=1 Tax=Aquabacterium sp. A3 TaxID=3132829 RepID=UPI00311A46B2
MKFTKIALAAVTLVAAQAHADTVYLAGASATSSNYRSALTAMCGSAGGSATELSSGSNLFAVKCTTDFAGLPGVDAVSFNVSGGSFTAVTTSAGTDTADFINPAASAPGAIVFTGARSSEGGFLDIDGAAFSADDLLAAGLEVSPATTPASFSQVFGVAVSNDLYTALQAAQGLASCGVDSITPECQPNITRAQYTSIVSDAFNTAKVNVNAVLGVGAEGDLLTVCRRVSTSGTQASSNQFFLNTYVGSDGANGGALAPATAADYGIANSGLPSFDVQEGSGTGNARACLSNSGFALGVLSLENAPDLTTRSGGARADRKWRFVKVNGVHAYEPAVNSTATAKNGSYEFWFTSHKYGHTANGQAVVDAIDTELSSGLDRAGLFDNASSQAKRSSNTSPVFFE